MPNIRRHVIPNGTEILPTGSQILWGQTKILPSKEKGRKYREFVEIVCGRCLIHRWVQTHNLYGVKKRGHTLTGFCSECCRRATWIERGRTRPEKRKVTRHGYMKLYIPENPMADKRGEVYEHRLIMSQMLGRALERSEHVHHKDGQRTNNAPGNLELVSTQENHLIRSLQERIAQLKQLLSSQDIPIPL